MNSSQIFFSWQHVQRHCHVETEWVISQTAGSHTGNRNMIVDCSIKFPFIMTFLVFFFFPGITALNSVDQIDE